jgi:hypothetical protein
LKIRFYSRYEWLGFPGRESNRRLKSKNALTLIFDRLKICDFGFDCRRNFWLLTVGEIFGFWPSNWPVKRSKSKVDCVYYSTITESIVCFVLYLLNNFFYSVQKIENMSKNIFIFGKYKVNVFSAKVHFTGIGQTGGPRVPNRISLKSTRRGQSNDTSLKV